MKIRSRRNKLVITSLDREGMSALMSGEYERVCELCEAICDEHSKALLDLLVTERLPGDVVEEGGVLWNTLWIGVNMEDGRFIGAVRILGKPTESRELNIALHPVDRYDVPAFARVFERVCEWIFSHRAVYYIRVSSQREDEIAFLRRYSFVLNKNDGLYEREKNRPAWVLLCLCLGLGTGVALGEIFGGLSIGMAIGSVFGIVIGLILDNVDVTRRKPK